MSTLDALKRLSDGQLHRLGDDLLRRLEPRYRRLRTHGINEKDESIKGQPDSYVGETADSCTVAVCYTAQRRGWWKKVVADVREALAVSPSCEEIIAVIPHNADRDGPRDKKIAWFSDACAAAGHASFRVIDGRELSHLLDTDHQDLRHELLHIPYSRLTASSILASARVASLEVLEDIRGSGRYEPERYAPRFADRELYGLWQRCLRRGTDGERRVAPVKLIALVNDSGVGKTSLVCSFAASLGANLPVVLIQARDLVFDAEHALVTHAIYTVQGVLEPGARVIEEAALTYHLRGSMPLTVIVDGLDEAHDPNSVRKAITFWLRSRLGQISVLIVTCRPEFWRVCADPSWKRWMPGLVRDEHSPVKIESAKIEHGDPEEGIRLPGRFTEAELEASWVQAGQPRAELYALAAEAREELRHPFTLRVYLDLCSQDGSRIPVVTRSDLMEQWLNRRLDAEAVPTERLDRNLFQRALRVVATRTATIKGGTVEVDDLSDVPRFDPARPPGPVVQRLIGANILESVPREPSRVRFTVEAVQDYYRAEADAEDIRDNAATVAQRFAELRFTDAYPRLMGVGRRLRNAEVRHLFVEELAEIAPRMAAIVIGVAPSQYSAEVRVKVTEALEPDILSRHRVRAAFAISILGSIDCPEAIYVLERNILPPADPHKYLKAVAAEAFEKLGYAPAAEFVYEWGGFGPRSGSESYYFREELGLLRRATPEFRDALANCAITRLASPSGTQEHAKSVCVLAYLGDDRLIGDLKARLIENGLLESYENHALVALGTDAAGALFVQSVLSVGKRLVAIPDDAANNEVRARLIDRMHLMSYDIRYLISPRFAGHVRHLIENDDSLVSWIGCELAQLGLVASLLHPAAVASARHRRWRGPYREDHRTVVTADLWLQWWQTTLDVQVRRELLGLAPLCPTAEVEEVLLDCLEVPELRRQAARQLGEYGAVRAGPRLRHVLRESDNDRAGLWDKEAAADALGRLRDHPSIPLLQALAVAHPSTEVGGSALMSLGFIGTSEGEAALRGLLDSAGDEDEIVEGLLACGTSTAMAVVITRAKQKLDGPYWLCERMRRLAWRRGWTRGEYYTHSHTKELVEYLLVSWRPGTPDQNWHAVDAFRQIDSPDVRHLLRSWAERRGSPTDPVARRDDDRRVSDLCNSQLRDRGDEFAIPYVLDDFWIQNRDDVYVAMVTGDLRHFSSSAVADVVGQRLLTAADNSQTVRMLALLGQFGDASDADLVRRFLGHEDDLVANVACDSLLRLEDPLLVPDHWREL